MSVIPITALELSDKIRNSDDLCLLDVREPHEFAYARIDDSVLIPLSQISGRLEELDPNRAIVVICHHGIRSLQAARFLARSGFDKVANLTGGIDAWSTLCDPSVPRY